MRIEPIPTRPGLQVVQDDGTVRPIHPLWLRERAEDPASLDPVNGQRLYDPSDLPADLAVREVTPLTAQSWRVLFSDGARIDYVAARLLAEAAPDAGLPPRDPWSGDLAPLPIRAWPPGPEGMLPLVEPLLRLGFVILRGVPSEEGQVLAVARRFGFPRDTNFGIMFDVRSVPQPIDLAYTGLPLDAHNDNPYRDPMPGVQLLHCLVNRSTGGYSTLVDGVTVAAAMRARDPEGYRLLCTVPVRFQYTDPATALTDHAPMIECSVTGEIVGIRFSPRLDYVPLLDEAELEAFYRARRRFDQMLRAPEFAIRFLLQDGDCVMFDNRRLLHGRTGFDPQEGPRHLQGCYIDIDGPRSLYRVLKRAPALEQAAE